MRQRQRIAAKDHAFVKSEKIRVGRCAMHPFMFDGQELLVTERNAVAFCWDHVDRATKTMSISAMIGRVAPPVGCVGTQGFCVLGS